MLRLTTILLLIGALALASASPKIKKLAPRDSELAAQPILVDAHKMALALANLKARKDLQLVNPDQKKISPVDPEPFCGVLEIAECAGVILGKVHDEKITKPNGTVHNMAVNFF
jgi:hypothetical protein